MNRQGIDKPLISEHIFLFPFVWEKPQKGLAQTDTFKELPNWQEDIVNITTDQEYNEFVYFYKPVRPVIYTYKDYPNITKNYTSKLLEPNSRCFLSVKGKEYKLKLQAICLKLYKTGIGILAITLGNDRYFDREDILNINGMCKSVYPHILPLEKAREDYFPEKIRLEFGKNIVIEEDFKEDYKQTPIQIASYLMKILGEPFKNKAFKGKGVIGEIVYIEPIIGSQMFTICLYRNAQMLEEIRDKCFSQDQLDSFVLLSNKTQEEIEKARLEHMGVEYIYGKNSIYGMSRYALVCILTEQLEGKLYDQLITIILLQRATLLSFSNQIAVISTLPNKELVVAIQNVYQIYNQFINQMYFEEVTQAIQGQLIYEKMLQKFKIQKELEQLDFEMSQIHDYAMLLDQSQSKYKMDLITGVGAALVIPTFATGFFGMNILEDAMTTWWQHGEALLWINTYVFLPIITLLSIYTWCIQPSKRVIIFRILALTAGIVSLLIVLSLGCGLKAS